MYRKSIKFNKRIISSLKKKMKTRNIRSIHYINAHESRPINKDFPYDI